MKQHNQRGRPLVESLARNRTMKFTDAEWAQLTKLGRAKWIRKQLAKAND